MHCSEIFEKTRDANAERSSLVDTTAFLRAITAPFERLRSQRRTNRNFLNDICARVCQRCARTSANIETRRFSPPNAAARATKDNCAHLLYRGVRKTVVRSSAVNFACVSPDRNLRWIFCLDWRVTERALYNVHARVEMIKNGLTCLLSRVTTFHAGDLLWSLMFFINIYLTGRMEIAEIMNIVAIKREIVLYIIF